MHMFSHSRLLLPQIILPDVFIKGLYSCLAFSIWKTAKFA